MTKTPSLSTPIASSTTPSYAVDLLRVDRLVVVSDNLLDDVITPATAATAACIVHVQRIP